MIYKKEFYEDLSESVDALDYSSYTLQYPPPFIWSNNFDNWSFIQSFQQSGIDTCWIYIHIPFCETKCTFCRYFSIIDSQEETHNKYIEHLIKELWMYHSVMTNITISSLYIWWGTPSALSSQNIDTLLNFFFWNFKLTENFQFCFEANPSSVTYEKMKLLAKYKCHRFTLWIQSLDTEVLRKVNRRQTTKQVIQSIKWAKDIWIDFINVDMMAGIKWQTMSSFLRDLKIVIALNPDMIHVHPYTSTVRVIDEKIYTTDEKLSIQMAKIWNAILEKEWYLSIEWDANWKDINSRNKQLFEAMEWWTYIWAWVSAVWYNWNYRYINHDTIDEYFSSIAQWIFPIKFASFVSERAKMIQYIIYTMRYGVISIPVFFSEFWKDIIQEFYEIFTILQNEEVVIISEDKIFFKYKTPKEYSVYSKYFYESSILDNFALNRKIKNRSIN